MSRPLSQQWWVFGLVAGCASAAWSCATGGSRLAKEDAGGAGGAGSGLAGGGLTGAGGLGGAAGAGGAPEPPGPTKLTVVNGLVDYDAIRVCFVPYPADTGGPGPWPETTGLDFARGLPIEPMDDVVPADTDVQLYVIGGDLAHTSGQTCDQILSDNPPPDVSPPVLVASAGVLPQSVFSYPRSLLLALHGCLGGPGHDHETVEDICGFGYDSSTPNVVVAAGFMSRQVKSTVVGMQFVHATAATPTSDLRVKPGVDGAVSYLAVPDWSLGAIAPYPPWWTLSLPALGNVPEAALEIHSGPNAMEHATSFAEALGNSTLGESDLVEGEAFVFVAVGASYSAPPEASDWWRGLTHTVLRADP